MEGERGFMSFFLVRQLAGSPRNELVSKRYHNTQRGVYRVFTTQRYWNALVVITIKRVLFCLLLDCKKKWWNMERQDGRAEIRKLLKNISGVSAESNFSTQEEKFRISKRPCNAMLIIKTPMKYQTISN